MKVNSPQLGFNNNVRHKGRVFHIQTEDSGVKHPHIITHLFADGGRILKTTKTSYAEFVGDEELPKRVRSLMQEQHKAMFIALRAGKFDPLIGDAPLEPAAAAPNIPTANPDVQITDPTSSRTGDEARLNSPMTVAATQTALEPIRETSLQSAQRFAGEALRLPSIPSSIDLDAEAAAALAAVAAAGASVAPPSGPETTRGGPPSIGSPPPSAAVNPADHVDGKPQVRRVPLSRPPHAAAQSPSAAQPPPPPPPATSPSGSALSRFAEKTGGAPPPSDAYRAVMARASDPNIRTGADASPLDGLRRATASKLEPPRSRSAPGAAPGPAPKDPPPPAAPPPAPNRKSSYRPPLTASLDLDLDVLERAAEQGPGGSSSSPGMAPLFADAHDLPPPPATVTKQILSNTSYRSITPQAAQIVTVRGNRTTPEQGNAVSSRGAGGKQAAGSSPQRGGIPEPPQSAPGRYAPSRPAAIFGSARPQEGSSIFGEDLISEKSLDEVILSYLAEDLDAPKK